MTKKPINFLNHAKFLMKGEKVSFSPFNFLRPVIKGGRLQMDASSIRTNFILLFIWLSDINHTAE
jgi:hypothetical protein